MATDPIVWSGGEHVFALRLGEIRALQDRTNAGPHELFTRIASGRWRIDDLMNTIRFGLIGGGMEPEKAGPLVEAVFSRGRYIEFVPLAKSILTDALVGPDYDPVGKAAGGPAPMINPEN